MKDTDKVDLSAEIYHIFDSGANEVRIFNMVEHFINTRYFKVENSSINSGVLASWEQFKKNNWWNSDAVDVEAVLMNKFVAIHNIRHESENKTENKHAKAYILTNLMEMVIFVTTNKEYADKTYSSGNYEMRTVDLDGNGYICNDK